MLQFLLNDWEDISVAKTNEAEVSVDRRRDDERREADDRRSQVDPVGEDLRQGDRRKVQRRRQIDPTTCERDYTDDEIEFMHALDDYKRTSGRMFPTCSEILEVIQGLGYVRINQDGEVQTAELSDTVDLGDEHFEEQVAEDSLV